MHPHKRIREISTSNSTHRIEYSLLFVPPSNRKTAIPFLRSNVSISETVVRVFVSPGCSAARLILRLSSASLSPPFYQRHLQKSAPVAHSRDLIPQPWLTLTYPSIFKSYFSSLHSECNPVLSDSVL
jgi:hypothetical protein